MDFDLFRACGRETLRGFWKRGLLGRGRVRADLDGRHGWKNPYGADNGALMVFGHCANCGKSVANAEKIENFLSGRHKSC